MEDRLKFYETGEAPKKNAEVMKSAVEEVSLTGRVKSRGRVQEHSSFCLYFLYALYSFLLAVFFFSLCLFLHVAVVCFFTQLCLFLHVAVVCFFTQLCLFLHVAVVCFFTQLCLFLHVAVVFVSSHSCVCFFMWL